MYIVTNCYIMTTLINCSQLRNARPPLLKPRTNERLKMCYLPYNHQDLRSINCTISNRGYIPSVKLHCNSKRRGTSLYFRKPVRLLHPIYITFFSSRRESFSFFPSVNSNSSIFVDEWTFNCCRSYWKKCWKDPLSLEGDDLVRDMFSNFVKAKTVWVRKNPFVELTISLVGNRLREESPFWLCNDWILMARQTNVARSTNKVR